MTLAMHNCALRLDSLRRRSEDRFGFLCGYGPFRTFSDPSSSLISEKDQITLDRLKSLFDPHASVIDPDLTAKLFSGQLANFRGAPERLSPVVCEAMRTHLGALLPSCGESDEASFTGIPLYGSVVPLRDLSDGYSSLVALIGNLFRYALASSDWKGDPAAVEGITLIDEVDAHLHPSWQRRVLPDLAKVFPNLQILATTHSPMVAASVDTRSILHVVRSEETNRVEVRRYEMALQGLETDEILTGPLFGLADTRDLGTERDEERYGELRQLTSPTETEVVERNSLARKLFGDRTEKLGRATKEVFTALEAGLAEKMKSESVGEQAQRLAEAERLIEKMLGGR